MTSQDRVQILQRLYDALKELIDKEIASYNLLDSERADLQGTVEGLRYDLEMTQAQLWGVEFAEEQIAETKARITSLEADMKALLEKRPELKTRNKKNKSMRWKNEDIRKMSEDVLKDIRAQNDLKFDIWKAKAALEVMETTLPYKQEIASIEVRLKEEKGKKENKDTNSQQVEDNEMCESGPVTLACVTIESVNLLRDELSRIKSKCAQFSDEIKALKDEKKSLKASLASLPSEKDFDPEYAANMLSDVRKKVREATVELTRFLRNPLTGYVHDEGGDDLHDEYPTIEGEWRWRKRDLEKAKDELEKVEKKVGEPYVKKIASIASS